MDRNVDVLTSLTLKHLRDRWWDAAFTAFLRDALQPQAGQRVLDVGCGAGAAELILSLLQPDGATFIGIDIVHDRVAHARQAAHALGLRVELATADAVALPFGNGVFDAAFVVAVLQHVAEPGTALAELARVTKPGARLVIVEPDNQARYWHSEPACGAEALSHISRFFAAVEDAEGVPRTASLGPQLPGWLRASGIEPLAMHLLPVSSSRLGAPVSRVWDERRAALRAVIDTGSDPELLRLGDAALAALDRYAAAATQAGAAFVEIQSTLLFATIAQRAPSGG